MKKIKLLLLTIIATAISLTSCSAFNEPDNCDFIGTYTGDDNEDYFTSILTIKNDGSFVHTIKDGQHDYAFEEKLEGKWFYDKASNIITLHYLKETIKVNDNNTNGVASGTQSYEMDMYAWAQPYNNGKKLRYKEAWDDPWEDYAGFTKKE